VVYDSFFCKHARKSRAVFEIIHMKKLFVFLFGPSVLIIHFAMIDPANYREKNRNM